MIPCFRLLDHFSFWYLQFLDTFSTCSSDRLPFLFPLLFSQQVVTYFHFILFRQVVPYSPYFLTKWSLIGPLFPLLFQHVVSYSLFYSLPIVSPLFSFSSRWSLIPILFSSDWQFRIPLTFPSDGHIFPFYSLPIGIVPYSSYFSNRWSLIPSLFFSHRQFLIYLLFLQVVPYSPYFLNKWSLIVPLFPLIQVVTYYFLFSSERQSLIPAYFSNQWSLIPSLFSSDKQSLIHLSSRWSLIPMDSDVVLICNM